ncbi:MAG: PorT family protein [Bacteroidales bacterium]|nr:PorT family protein [Bacteroidales bacterium]
MKSTLAVVLFSILIMFGGDIFAQRFKGEVIGGTNISHITGDRMRGFPIWGAYKTSLNFGLGVIAPLTDKLDISIETLYSDKGAVDLDGATRRISLTYLEAPLLVLYELDPGVFGGIGLSYGQLFSSEETDGQFTFADQKYVDKGVFKEADLNMLLDTRFPIYKNLKFNFRYSFSLLPIRKSVYEKPNTSNGLLEENLYNHVMSFRVIWVFNEKPGKKKIEKIEDYQ